MFPLVDLNFSFVTGQWTSGWLRPDHEWDIGKGAKESGHSLFEDMPVGTRETKKESVRIVGLPAISFCDLQNTKYVW
jgi:hypothetical protein